MLYTRKEFGKYRAVERREKRRKSRGEGRRPQNRWTIISIIANVFYAMNETNRGTNALTASNELNDIKQSPTEEAKHHKHNSLKETSSVFHIYSPQTLQEKRRE